MATSCLSSVTLSRTISEKTGKNPPALFRKIDRLDAGRYVLEDGQQGGIVGGMIIFFRVGRALLHHFARFIVEGAERDRIDGDRTVVVSRRLGRIARRDGTRIENGVGIADRAYAQSGRRLARIAIAAVIRL